MKVQIHLVKKCVAEERDGEMGLRVTVPRDGNQMPRNMKGGFSMSGDSQSFRIGDEEMLENLRKQVGNRVRHIPPQVYPASCSSPQRKGWDAEWDNFARVIEGKHVRIPELEG